MINHLEAVDMKTVIGLTGGIATGKSTMAALLAKRDIPIIDTDQIARELVQPGSPYLAQIILRFGRSILLPSGQLNRRQLRQHIMDDAHTRQWLEALLHPAIRHSVLLQLAQLDGVIVVMIPLLKDRHTYPLDIVWTIDVPEHIQIARVMQRDHCDLEHAKAIVAAQPTIAQRYAISDRVINNTTNLKVLEQQIDRLWRQLPH